MTRQLFFTAALAGLLFGGLLTAQPPQGSQPDFIRQGNQLVREGKPAEALALYAAILKAMPDSAPANNAAGVLLDQLGRGDEARAHFQKAIDSASTPQSKAAAERAMAMSWAFSGNCSKTVEYEQRVLSYYVATKDFYQQGEIADEAARVCLDAGSLDVAWQWYLTGHQLGLRQPDITPDRKNLWEFRWENAQARIAARRGNQTEADKHVKAAAALLEADPEMAKAQARFLPYLEGYVAYYRGDYETALARLSKADSNDPMIQCLLADTHEKLGHKAEAGALYEKASKALAHNPPAAFAVPLARRKLSAL